MIISMVSSIKISVNIWVKEFEKIKSSWNVLTFLVFQKHLENSHSQEFDIICISNVPTQYHKFQNVYIRCLVNSSFTYAKTKRNAQFYLFELAFLALFYLCNFADFHISSCSSLYSRFSETLANTYALVQANFVYCSWLLLGLAYSSVLINCNFLMIKSFLWWLKYDLATRFLDILHIFGI